MDSIVEALKAGLRIELVEKDGDVVWRAMETTVTTPDRLNALRELTLSEVEQRIAELDAERKSLAVIRSSLAARERAKKKLRPNGGQQ